MFNISFLYPTELLNGFNKIMTLLSNKFNLIIIYGFFKTEKMNLSKRYKYILPFLLASFNLRSRLEPANPEPTFEFLTSLKSEWKR